MATKSSYDEAGSIFSDKSSKGCRPLVCGMSTTRSLKNIIEKLHQAILQVLESSRDLKLFEKDKNSTHILKSM